MGSGAIGDMYRVVARNTAPDSENRIHSDETAARFGFRGGLVPGVAVFGYLTTPVVALHGLDWLRRGSATVRLIAPAYEGEAVTCTLDDGLRATAVGEDQHVRATATFALDHAASPADFSDFPLPDSRPEAGWDTLAAGTPLGSFTAVPAGSMARHGEGDPLPFYREVQHPAVLLGLANEILMRNVKLGPWIHAASEIANFSEARRDEPLTVRGLVLNSFERKGHCFVELDVSISASGRPVTRVRHTAIWKPRPLA